MEEEIRIEKKDRQYNVAEIFLANYYEFQSVIFLLKKLTEFIMI
jgi:hypothetical protein